MCAFYALYFSQKYFKYCHYTILLDPSLITLDNLKIRLELYKNEFNIDVGTKLNNKQLSHLLNKIKNEFNMKDAEYVQEYSHYIRTKFIMKHLKIKFKIPVISFINIDDPDKNKKYINNKMKLNEVSILKTENKENFTPIVFTNKSHYIFNKKQTANKIIQNIKQIIR